MRYTNLCLLTYLLTYLVTYFCSDHFTVVIWLTLMLISCRCWQPISPVRAPGL